MVLQDAHFGDPETTPHFVELLGLVISRPSPTIFRKQRFGKIHISLDTYFPKVLHDAHC